MPLLYIVYIVGGLVSLGLLVYLVLALLKPRCSHEGAGSFFLRTLL